ncbi:MAG: hypothetical protein GF330_04640 [Candidatus Eisenbacteria bacterium]|nr:hypothetical protein [Candidatus Eisenbacteria bacterium]
MSRPETPERPDTPEPGSPRTESSQAGSPQTASPQTGNPQTGSPQPGTPRSGARRPDSPDRSGRANPPGRPDRPAPKARPETPERDRVEFEIPSGVLVVRHARCLNGCDLMAPERPIHDEPSIHLAYELEGRRGDLYVDPVYGSHDNISDAELPKGAVPDFFCPHCNSALQEPGTSCSACSAPLFTLHLPEGGQVEACQRIGCFSHRLRLVSSEQQMRQLFDDLGMDSFL